jgi:hypothetical protein
VEGSKTTTRRRPATLRNPLRESLVARARLAQGDQFPAEVTTGWRKPEAHVRHLCPGQGNCHGGTALGGGEAVVVAGEAHPRTESAHQRGQHRNAHLADSARRLAAKGLVHQQHAGSLKPVEGGDIGLVEVAYPLPWKGFRLPIPRRREVARQADNPDAGPRHNVLVARPEVMPDRHRPP